MLLCAVVLQSCEMFGNAIAKVMSLAPSSNKFILQLENMLEPWVWILASLSMGTTSETIKIRGFKAIKMRGLFGLPGKSERRGCLPRCPVPKIQGTSSFSPSLRSFSIYIDMIWNLSSSAVCSWGQTGSHTSWSNRLIFLCGCDLVFKRNRLKNVLKMKTCVAECQMCCVVCSHSLFLTCSEQIAFFSWFFFPAILLYTCLLVCLFACLVIEFLG